MSKILELTRADLKEEFQNLDLFDIELSHVNWKNWELVCGFDCEYILVDGENFWEQKRLDSSEDIGVWGISTSEGREE